jgi:uncharacterized protein
MFRFPPALAILSASLLIADSSTYVRSIQEWQKNRDAKLRAPDSWLTLVGLFWLKPGENSIALSPASAARIRVEGTRVTLIEGKSSERNLSYDDEKPDVIHTGSVFFYVIKRGDKFAVRVKDSNSAARRNFVGMKYFPINLALHFQARFIADAKKIPILNIVGQTDLEDSPGLVEFTYQGQQYHLRPIFEGDTLFFLFKDPTNKTQTYQAGRMLNTPLPKDGKVDLDFNRSYNPPCTFTPYATCPLPPKENTLPFPVQAGELRYGQGHVEYAAR